MISEKVKFWFTKLLHLMILSLLVSCEFLETVEKKSKMINNFEKAALHYARETRDLKIQVSKLEYKIKTLESENHFLKIKLENKEGKDNSLPGRGGEGMPLAQNAPAKGRLPGLSDDEDLVKFHIYRWRPEQLLTIAQTSFEEKEYEKSAQFFHAFIQNFPRHKSLDDQLYFQAGLAAYKTQRHYAWAEDYLKRLMNLHPTSSYFRSSKLWLALTQYKQGQHKEFFKIVEEFRLKYRNTPEWKILSAHYEELAHKFKKK